MRVQGDPALGSMRVESAPALVRQRIIRLLVNLRSSRWLWSAPSQSHALPLILVRRCLALLVLHAHRNAVARPLEPLSFSVHHAPPAPPPPKKTGVPALLLLYLQLSFPRRPPLISFSEMVDY